MYKNKKIFCIVLARKNSNGIKKKNLRKLKNKPLIWYPINAAKKSKYIDEVYFNSEGRKLNPDDWGKGVYDRRAFAKEDWRCFDLVFPITFDIMPP